MGFSADNLNTENSFIGEFLISLSNMDMHSGALSSNLIREWSQFIFDLVRDPQTKFKLLLRITDLLADPKSFCYARGLSSVLCEVYFNELKEALSRDPSKFEPFLTEPFLSRVLFILTAGDHKQISNIKECSLFIHFRHSCCS